jgi:hypothetical protein
MSRMVGRGGVFDEYGQRRAPDIWYFFPKGEALRNSAILIPAASQAAVLWMGLFWGWEISFDAFFATLASGVYLSALASFFLPLGKDNDFMVLL